jgi:hypothetical protein
MKTRTHPEPQTVAYMAIGANDAIASIRGSNPAAHDRAIEACEGHLGLIGEVIERAITLDTYADHHPDALRGVFAYEIAEPFGRALATQLIEYRGCGGPFPNALAIIREVYEAQD